MAGTGPTRRCAWCCSAAPARSTPTSAGRSSTAASAIGSSGPVACPDADRDALIAGATALVFPSRYEGFGAPLVEAMAARHSRGLRRSPRPSRGRRRRPRSCCPTTPTRGPARWRRSARRRAELIAAGRRTRHPLHAGRVRRGARRRVPPDAPLMRLVVPVPPFRPDTAPTGHVMSRIVARTGGTWSRGARRDRLAVVPRSRHRAGLDRPVGAPAAHGLGIDHPRPPVPGR